MSSFTKKENLNLKATLLDEIILMKLKTNGMTFSYKSQI